MKWHDWIESFPNWYNKVGLNSPRIISLLDGHLGDSRPFKYKDFPEFAAKSPVFGVRE